MRELHESQVLVHGAENMSVLNDILGECGARNVLLVCGKSFFSLKIAQVIKDSMVSLTIFQDFSSNPQYEDIVLGVKSYREHDCDTILAIGGGSAIDVAKCIKAFVPMRDDSPYYKQPIVVSRIPLVALPTTAGTGSESTQFAVIYIDGEKASLSHPCILPDYAILEPSVLQTLPLYQKKCSMLDALCQALESWWSVNADSRSINFAKQAVKQWLEAQNGYLENSIEENKGMLLASNLAGRAINITKTTAPHAMSYKMTTLFKIPHGHAVALAFPHVWRFMLEHPQACIDERGAEYVLDTFIQMASALGQQTVEQAIMWFSSLLEKLEILPPNQVNPEEFDMLIHSVNLERLKNSPMQLDLQALTDIYAEIFQKRV